MYELMNFLLLKNGGSHMINTWTVKFVNIDNFDIILLNMGDEIKHLREIETLFLSVTPKKSTDQSNDQGKILGV